MKCQWCGKDFPHKKGRFCGTCKRPSAASAGYNLTVPVEMKGQSGGMDGFQRGVLYAAGLIMALHDLPTVAADLLREAGFNDADCSGLDDFDKYNLRRLQGERGVKLRGL